jgi:hypothetical protein
MNFKVCGLPLLGWRGSWQEVTVLLDTRATFLSAGEGGLMRSWLTHQHVLSLF